LDPTKQGHAIREVMYHSIMRAADIDQILSHFGLTGAYRRVTLGKGVVGKSTSGFLGLCGIFGIVAVGLVIAGNPLYLIGLAVLAAAIYLFFQRSVVTFATQNPATALLEGSDWVKWHQAEIGAKDLKEIPDTPLIVDPQNPIQFDELSK
jgi:hypothetical protein